MQRPGSLTVSTLAVGFVLCTATRVLAEDEASVIAPFSQWSVDYGLTECRLGRTFGEGNNRHLLFIEQSQPGRTFGLTVAGPELKRFRSLRTTKIHFFDGQKPKRTEPLKGDVEGYGDALVYPSISLEKGDESASENDGEYSTLPQLDPVFANQVGYVALKQGSRKVRLATGPLGDAFKVLNDCTQDMVRSWGLDVEKHLTATRLPRWKNQSSVVRRIQAIYPANALGRGEQGIFRMRVVVSESGTVTDCVINNTTVQDRLQSPACKAMLKAEFEPALDTVGQPFQSYYATSITYRVN